ncbi:MAG: glycosyltransferase [Fibromonadaceae bacterium]|jgi:spore maturation protein CgeB|nr:glycosyltransferase [Fibromonadaceae bacterium]
MRCEHFNASSGQLSARIYGDGFERLLHSALEPEQERNWFRPNSIGGIIFAFGTGLGYHLEFLKDFQKNEIPLIILCDAFAENLSIVKEKLAGQNVALFSDDLSQFESIFKNNKLTVIRHPAASRYCVNQAESTLKTILNLNFTTAQPTAIALPFGTHFLQQEILNATKELQIPCMTLPQQSRDPSQQESLLMELFQKNTPHLVLSVNAKGIDSEGVLLSVCNRFSVPVHIWFVDDPRPIACLFSEEQCKNIVAWTWEKAYIPWLLDKNFAKAEWLPLAGDTHLFYPQNKKSIYDLVFTGSAIAGNFLEEIWKHVQYDKEEALPIAQSAAEQILAREVFAHQIPADTKAEAWFASYCIHLASAEKRRLCLEPLLALGLVFAGDPSGWKNLFGSDIKTLPDIDYRSDLCSHYSSGNIHINITSCQMPSAVNQRVFDIPLCERFVISDDQSDLFELFPKNAICVANSPEAYTDLAKFYMKNPAAKQEIIKNAREHILKEHLYLNRISEIIKIVSRET